MNHYIFLKILDSINQNIEKNTPLDEIYHLIGNNTGFLKKETIYKVKKDE